MSPKRVHFGTVWRDQSCTTCQLTTCLVFVFVYDFVRYLMTKLQFLALYPALFFSSAENSFALSSTSLAYKQTDSIANMELKTTP